MQEVISQNEQEIAITNRICVTVLLVALVIASPFLVSNYFYYEAIRSVAKSGCSMDTSGQVACPVLGTKK